MFTILCLLCLYENREYPGSFQNESVSSSFRRGPSIFCSWPNWREKEDLFNFGVDKHRNLLSKLSLTCRVILNIIKMLIILFLLCLWKQWISTQFSKQISKFFFRLSVQIYSFLGQTEEERKAFCVGCKKGTALWDYPQEHFVVVKDEKVCPFLKFEIILPLLCFY